jgi:hypothetical protein
MIVKGITAKLKHKFDGIEFEVQFPTPSVEQTSLVLDEVRILAFKGNFEVAFDSTYIWSNPTLRRELLENQIGALVRSLREARQGMIDGKKVT